MPLSTDLPTGKIDGDAAHTAGHNATNTRVNAIATEVNAHEALTTGVHGITDTAALVTTGALSELVDDRVNALLVAGTGVTKTYNDAANTLTLAATGGGGGADSRVDALETIRASVPIELGDPQWGGLTEGGDCTAAFNAAFAAAATSGRAVHIPTGNWGYTGTPKACWWVPVYGDGLGRSNIILSGSATYFYQIAEAMEYLYFHELSIIGGQGAINHTYTGDNVINEYIVSRCLFKDYTRAAISSDAGDMPYWKITENVFWGLDYATTMGVALGGGSDLSVIESNAFLQNRVHVKLIDGSNTKVRDNDFIRFDVTRPNGPAVALWLVPDNSGGDVGAGIGFEASGNKYGNENLVTGDFHVLVANDTGAGANGTRFPVLNANSTGMKSAIYLHDETIAGATGAPTPYVYSTAANFPGGIQIGRTFLAGNAPTYMVQFRTPANVVPGLSSTTVIGPVIGTKTGQIENPAPLSNAILTPYLADPSAQMLQGGVVAEIGGADPGGRSELLSVASRVITTWFLTSCTRAAATDSMNSTNAQELTYTAGGDTTVQLSAFTPGKLAWIDFDIQRSVTAPIDVLTVMVIDTAFAAYHLERIVRVPTHAGWERYRIPLLPRTAGTPAYLTFVSPTAGRVRIGRVRAYHAREPQLEDIVMYSANGTKYKITPPPNTGGAVTWTAV